MNTIPAIPLTSDAFDAHTMIPSQYTCEGANINPPLLFPRVPFGTKSLALIMDDPDTSMGTWVHWVRFNIPATTTMIAENQEPEGDSGKASGGNTTYKGPCPPTGTHRYFFKVYALDATLALQTPDKETLLKAMEGHIIGYGELIGLYKKQGK
jgi:Raf kinase inhibitor-like YbhB/YbcL family protein